MASKIFQQARQEVLSRISLVFYTIDPQNFLPHMDENLPPKMATGNYLPLFILVSLK